MDLRRQREHWVEKTLSPALEGVAVCKRLVLDAQIQLVKIEVDTGDDRVKVDLCMCPTGLQKSSFILDIYSQCTWHFPLFSCIMAWARACGLIRQSDGTGVIATGEVHAMVISLCELTACGEASVAAMPRNTEELLSRAEAAYGGLTERKPDKQHMADAHAFGTALLRFFQVGAKLEGAFAFTWPVDGKPEHHVGESAINVFATCCARAVHVLGVTGSFEGLLRHAMSSKNTPATLTRLLSPTLSKNMLESSVHFHRARLEVISGCASVSLEADGQGIVTLAATGSLHELALLRAELARLRRVGYSLAAGRIAQRSSIYFMQDSTILMARGYASRDIGVLFCHAPTAPHQLFHAQRSISMALSVTRQEHGDGKEWKQAFTVALREKVLEQVTKLDCASKLVDTLRIAVHFGLFYAVDASSVLESTGGGILLPELEAAIVAQRLNRKLAERREWDEGEVARSRAASKPLAAQEDEALKMVELKHGGGSGDDGGGEGGCTGTTPRRASKGPPRGKIRRRRLCCAFWCGITEDPADIDAHAAAEGQVVLSLQTCGFTEQSTDGLAAAEDRPWSWSVNLVPSRSRIVVARLDDTLKVVSVAERRLTWVSATLIAGSWPFVNHERDSKAVLNVHDLRIKLQTTEAVVPGSQLHRQVVEADGTGPLVFSTTNAGGTSRSVVGFKRRRPVPRKKGMVSFARHTRSVRAFTGPMGLKAFISSGVQYEGTELNEEQLFSELSLAHDLEFVREWRRGYLSRESVAQSLDTLAVHILELSEQLRNV